MSEAAGGPGAAATGPGGALAPQGPFTPSKPNPNATMEGFRNAMAERGAEPNVSDLVPGADQRAGVRDQVKQLPNRQQAAEEDPQVDQDASGEEAPLDGEQEPEEAVAGEAESAALLEALQGAVLPEQLLGKLIPITIDGQTYDVTIEEAGKGYMRNITFSRENRKMREREAGLNQLDGSIKNFLGQLTNPKTLPQMLRSIPGAYEAYVESAKDWVLREHELSQLPEQQRALHYRNEQLEFEMGRRERELQRLQQIEQERQQQIPNPQAQVITHQLQQLVPRAFKMHGLGAPSKTDKPTMAEEIFGRHMMVFAAHGQVTPQIVDQAARAAREELDELMGGSGYQQPTTRSQALGATRATGAAAPGRTTPKFKPTAGSFREQVINKRGMP